MKSFFVVAAFLLPGVLTATPPPYGYQLAQVSTSPRQEVLNVFNWKDQASLTTVPLANDAAAIATNPNGDFVYVLNSVSSTIAVVSTSTNKIVSTIQLPAPKTSNDSYSSLAVAPDGKTIWAVHTSTVVVVCAISHVVLHTFQIPNAVTAAVYLFSPDGRVAYFEVSRTISTGDLDTYLDWISVATGTVEREVELGLYSGGPMALSPTGSSLYVLSSIHLVAESELSVVETATGNISGTTLDGSPVSLAITPDGKTVYAGTTTFNSPTEFVLSVFDTATKSIIRYEEPNSFGGVSVTLDGADYWLAERNGVQIEAVTTGVPVTFLSMPVANVSPVLFLQ